MYESYYGLHEAPFRLTSNPRYLMLMPGHGEALNSIQYGLTSRRGIILLVGDAGTGKTTVVRAAKAAAPAGARIVAISNPLLTRTEFLQQVAEGFALDVDPASSKPRFLAALTATLEALAQQGTVAALVIDEAHVLPNEILEEVRLLANIETDEDKLLPVALVGQPELSARLNEPHLRQLKQRIALRATLGPLGYRDTAAYIAGRILVAGGDAAQIFGSEAVALIYRGSRGLPRTMSVICDNALVAGFAAGERPIGGATIRQVCRDLDIDVPDGPARTDRAAPSEDRVKPGRVASKSEPVRILVPAEPVRRRRLFGF